MTAPSIEHLFRILELDTKAQQYDFIFKNFCMTQHPAVAAILAHEKMEGKGQWKKQLS